MESSSLPHMAPARVQRLTLDLFESLARVGAEEGLEAWEMELAAAHLLTTTICALGTTMGMGEDALLAHTQHLGPLLVQDVRTKLAYWPCFRNDPEKE